MLTSGKKINTTFSKLKMPFDESAPKLKMLADNINRKIV
jgi:hypothetical protein